MKLALRLGLNLLLLLFGLFTLGDKAFSLSDYQIKKICKKEKKKSTCIKNLKDKKINLQKGNLIEIPVIPYKR